MAFSMAGGTGRMRLGPRMEPSKLQIFRQIGKERRLREQAEAERDQMARRITKIQADTARGEARQRLARSKSFVNRVKAFFLRKVI